MKPKKYGIPQLTQFDFPMAPYPNTWYPICLSSFIKKNKHHNFRITGKELIVYRTAKGAIKCIPRHCPHLGVDISYGYIDEDCMVCPMHCKRVKPETQNNTFAEETHNIIFVWVGDKSPSIKISTLFKQNNLDDFAIFPYFHFSRKIGGHLVDYAEHVYDIRHASYIHGVSVALTEKQCSRTKHSFAITIKSPVVEPTFTFITPTVGNIEYCLDGNVCIMFIVHNIGDMEMVLMPCWKGMFNVKKLICSFIWTLY
eukprot:71248_1